ncbi:MAG: hypothetical protein ACK5NG_02745 [Chthoniobacterales bacterium]
MNGLLKAQTAFLQKPLNLLSRALLVLSAVFIVAAAYFPLWHINLVAPQYEEGLNMYIYSYQIKGGNNGHDLTEIDMLNHYIGMKSISQTPFIEMQIMTFMFGLFIMLALRAAVMGYIGAVVDLFFLASYFGCFAIGSFFFRLYTYGHNLDPTAPVQIEPFTPILFGTQQIANFVQSSYPELGSYFLFGFVLLLVLSIWFSRKEEPLTLS